ICFVGLMFFLINEEGGESINRIYVEKFVVVAIGIACIYTGIKQIIDYKTYLEGIPKPMLDELSTQLELFKSLDISVKDITHCINKDKEKYFVNNPVIVHSVDVIEALEKFRAKKINIKEFIVWCNLISFSDCYHFDPDRMDEIGSIITDIHRRIETNEDLTIDQIDSYIQALHNHTEI
ncbi:MAG: hypothetical protein JXQ23_03475, partial [Clostridia bacterium]|nr:hypothetical protein [Clostridia bacterium]